jgi:Initiator Replication protein
MRGAGKVIKPTGDLLREPDKPATIPVPTDIVTVQVNGPYTATDRKLWSLLLHIGWAELEAKSKIGVWHEIEMVELRRIYEQFAGGKDTLRLWEAAERLTQTTAKFSHHDKLRDTRVKTLTSIFAAQTDEEAREGGTFRYMFPAPLIPIVLEPYRFARLRLQFMLSLKSKYSITLYELFEGVANCKTPILTASVAEIRSWLNVPQNKLTQWDYLWKKAVKPALDEITKNEEMAGITITHQLIREGRGNKVKGIKFFVAKTRERRMMEKDISTPKTSQVGALPQFSGSIYEKARKAAPGWDVYALENEFREWIQKKGHQPKNVETAFIGFCKQKGSAAQAG